MTVNQNKRIIKLFIEGVFNRQKIFEKSKDLDGEEVDILVYAYLNSNAAELQNYREIKKEMIKYLYNKKQIDAKRIAVLFGNTKEHIDKILFDRYKGMNRDMREMFRKYDPTEKEKEMSRKILSCRYGIFKKQRRRTASGITFSEKSKSFWRAS